jgi:hypothetical protein
MRMIYMIQKCFSLHCMIGVGMIIMANACQPEPSASNSVKQGTIAQLDTAQYTTIAWKDTLVNFETAKEGDTVRMDFWFTNTGTKLLFISDVRSSCGCTIADYPKEPVAPGKDGAVKAVFSTERHPGEHRKLVLVRANTKGRTSHKLIFTGLVIPKPKPKQKLPPGSK